MNKIENKGFILKPEFYSQEEWCELYLQLIKNCQEMKRKINKKDNNWNDLKKYVEEVQNGFPYDEFIKKNKLLDKIKEIESK